MERALVVVDDVLRRRDLLRRPDEPDLLGDAGVLAAGAGASLVVLVVASEDGGSVDAPSDHEAATRLVAEKLRYVDVPVDVVGPLEAGSDLAGRIIAVADAEAADHVFLAGERRTPTGKAVFGDLAQQVVLGFDGPVTVATR